MRAGPKRAVDPSPLPFDCDLSGSARFAAFCEEFVRVPKGSGALSPLVLRDWQRDLVGSVLDAPVQPRTAGWMLPRGQGKSSLVAALGVFELMLGPEGATVVVVAVDERQAGIVFNIARRMVELDERLASRVQVFKDRLYIPERDASFQCLPAEPKRLEGLDFTLAILDELGVVNRDSYEVLTLAQGKREKSTLVGIGTPGPDPAASVLADMRAYAKTAPDDESFVWREHSAAGYEDHPVDCEHCWKLANPALGDFLHRDALVALLPPKTREATFRRARLCQFVTDSSNSFLPAGVWDGLGTGQGVPDGARAVIALDGSFNGDSTALVVATVAAAPHVDVAGLWEKPRGAGDDWRVPVAEVEQAIRDACRRWDVVEVCYDPYRFTRTGQALADEGLPMVEFPQSVARLTAATGSLLDACHNAGLTHSGDPRMALHVGAATLVEDNRGVRLSKASRQRTARKIDLAAALLMAHSRATWAAKPKKRRRARSFTH